MKNSNGLWCGKFLLVVAPFVFSAGVHASDVAVLDEIQGTVMIDRGEGYSIAHRGEALQEGDRVVTMDASGAVLKHNDGCIAQLAENSMVKMEQVSVCKSNNGSLKKSGPFVAAAIGVRPSPNTTATDYPAEPIFESAEEMAVEEPVLSEVVTTTESTGAVASSGTGMLAGVSTGTMIAIGAGAAALLAVVAGGGGGSSATNH